MRFYFCTYLGFRTETKVNQLYFMIFIKQQIFLEKQRSFDNYNDFPITHPTSNYFWGEKQLKGFIFKNVCIME